jgi:hypothetical protein
MIKSLGIKPLEKKVITPEVPAEKVVEEQPEVVAQEQPKPEPKKTYKKMPMSLKKHE